MLRALQLSNPFTGCALNPFSVPALHTAYFIRPGNTLVPVDKALVQVVFIVDSRHPKCCGAAAEQRLLTICWQSWKPLGS